MKRTISNNGLKFTAAWEQLKTKAYRATSQEKYLTIGFGHYGPDVKPGDTITEDGAYNLLSQDMNEAVKLADSIASYKFNQAQFDAICDLIFNVGPKAVAAGTGTGQAIRAGDVETLRTKLPQFRNQLGKPYLGIYRRAIGRLALFDGKTWSEAERIGREVKSL
ncbi:lysin [Salmonella phage vB_SenP_UTK0001]|nr:lysin [Salmonella phage vB_SenP_UTK0001]